MKNILIDNPSQKIMSRSYGNKWLLLYSLPLIIIPSAINIFYSFNKNSIITWTLIVCFFVYLAWMTTIILVGIKKVLKNSNKFKSYSESQQSIFKWMAILICVALDMVLPFSLVSIISLMSIGIIILFEIGLTTIIYYKVNISVLFKKEQKSSGR